MPDTRFLRTWIIRFLILIPVGAIAGGTLLTIPLFLLVGLILDIAHVRSAEPAMAAFFLGSALAALTGVGAALGLVQGQLLGGLVRKRLWIAVSAAALPVGAALGYGAALFVASAVNVGDRYLRMPGFAAFAVTGTFLGAAQAIILRQRVSRAFWWPLVNMSALGGAHVIYVATAGLLSGPSTGRGDPIGIIGPLLPLIVALAGGVGLITGVGMMALLEHPVKRYVFPGILLVFGGLVAVTSFSDYRTRAAEPPVKFALEARGTVRVIAWTQNGAHLSSVEEDGTVQVWETSTGKELSSAMTVGNFLGGVASLSPDATRVVTMGDHTILWDASTGRAIATIPGQTRDIREIAWSPSGALLAIARPDSTLQIADGWTGKVVAMVRFPVHDQYVARLVWTPSGKKVATAGKGNAVRIWDTSGRQVSVLLGQENVTALGWSPDERHLAIGAGVEVRIWDTQRHDLSRTLRPHVAEYTANVEAIKWSPDGERLAAIVLSGVHVWNIQTWAEEFADYDRVGVTQLAWNPSGIKLAFIFQALRQVSILDVRLRREVALHGHTGDVHALAWSPNGRLLATGGADRTIRLWRTESSARR